MSIQFDVDGFASVDISKDEARTSLANYFATNAGRYFDDFARNSDPGRFTADDVAAVATLSVPLEAGSVIGLLVDRADTLAALLGDPRMPEPRATLWEVDPSVLEPDQPLALIYEELKRIPGISYVRASKLLAAKRPHLVPIRDSVVEQLLKAGTDWWRPMREVVSDALVRSGIESASAGLPLDGVSLLRRLDVILWSKGKQRGLGTRRT